MQIIKPDNLALFYTTGMLQEKLCLFLAVMAHFTFDLSTSDRLLDESEMWQTVAAELGDDEPLDMGRPKQRGEYLVYGSCFSREPVTGLEVDVSVGGLSKKLYVTGPRYWWALGLPRTPLPFTEMRICHANAFGGEMWPANPLGKGIAPDREGYIPVPNIQDPGRPIKSPQDRPEPAGFTAYQPFWPQRKRYLGKFDRHWRENRRPHYPLDTDPEYFNTAPADQRLKNYFKGDEPIRIVNMHPDKPEIVSGLPGVRPRIFINRLKDGREDFQEVSARAETLWLFPGRESGILLFRGVTPAADEELDDFPHLMTDWESMLQPGRPLDYYHRVFLETVGLSPKEAPVEAVAPLPAPDTPAKKPLDEEPETSPPPFEPPPPSSEAKQIIDQVQKHVAEAEVQAEILFRKLGLTREEAVKRFLPSPRPEQIVSPKDIDRIVAQAEADLESGLKKLGLAKEDIETMLPRPEKPLEPRALSRQVSEAMNRAEAFFGKLGVTGREDLKRVLPGFNVSDLDLSKIAADLDLLALKLEEADGEAANAPETPPTVAEADPKIIETEARLTVDEIMARHRRGMKLSDLDLSGLDFSGKELDQADFSGSILAKARFNGAVLKGADFSGCLLLETNFSHARMEGVILKRVQAAESIFCGANLAQAIIARSEFSRADFEKADLTGTRIDGASFYKARLKGVNCQSLHATGTSFSRADLTAADFSSSELVRTDLSNTVLDGFICGGARTIALGLDGAVGKKADFSDAVLSKSQADNKTHFIDSRFSGADLSHSCWEGARITDARMVASNLNQADFSRTIMENTLLVNSTARRTKFMKAKLTWCDLRGINLFQASLRKARLFRCDMKDSNLFGADLTGAIITHSDTQRADFRRVLYSSF